MGRVEGKIVLVTGAGSGLGEASAQLLAREVFRPTQHWPTGAT
jgi:NADP-dependent 3-hydroxy acid dehydrogenase YdfG